MSSKSNQTIALKELSSMIQNKSNTQSFTLKENITPEFLSQTILSLINCFTEEKNLKNEKVDQIKDDEYSFERYIFEDFNLSEKWGIIY
jgi:hypothetical protein